ncbi:outer membrane efflux protein [Janthinobacterium sp. HH01]|uniref:TolC family protein n=1 Tax=Janthinobacterium sp. HH01 TaxID=1198452 RepID=UPI0002AED803|nr:TolC family protein [Janthinobacterium sp. HH01]ELX09440.1 outer membrane efflux protein [Janthinobacterium sp. HH01]
MTFKLNPLGALVSLALCAALPAAAQVTFRDYASAVAKYSLDLQMQRENVSSAQAGVSIAGVRPDPVLTAGIDSKELSAANKPNASTAMTMGMALTIETAGKRAQRIRVAQSAVKLGEATLEGGRRQLYADAAEAYAESCRARNALERQEATLRALGEIVNANNVRRKVGDIGGLELAQSQVEHDRFEADVVTARAQVQTSAEALSIPLGRRYSEVFGNAALACDSPAVSGLDDVEQLVRQAQDERDDIRIAHAALDAARSSADLAQANRWVDPVVNVSLKNTPAVRPVLDAGGAVSNSPTQRSLSLGLTVSVPIPLSRTQRGEVLQAQSAVTQATLALRSAELKAQTDVRRVYAQFRAAQANEQRYRDSVLVHADKVAEGMRLSYKKGAASLLELLSAQRSADEVYLAWLQATADLATATVQLQLAAGASPD